MTSSTAADSSCGKDATIDAPGEGVTTDAALATTVDASPNAAVAPRTLAM